MPRFEDSYIGDIVGAVATELGVFKRPPSMLLLGSCAPNTSPDVTLANNRWRPMAIWPASRQNREH
jgi:hypothetical protein